MFTHHTFPKIGPLSLDLSSIEEKNQALKLLLVTAAVNLVLYLDLWVKKFSSFIFTIISNTISVIAERF